MMSVCLLFLAGHNIDVLNLALVQYHFSQSGHQLKITPHRNAHYRQSYVRTMPSVMTLCKLKKRSQEDSKACSLVCESGSWWYNGNSKSGNKRTCIAPYFCATWHITVPDTVSGKFMTIHKAFIFRELGVHVYPTSVHYDSTVTNGRFYCTCIELNCNFEVINYCECPYGIWWC